MNFVVKIVISLLSKYYATNSKFQKTRLYDLMTSHMIHNNCFKIKNVVCHDKNDVCIKRFFKSLRNITNINHSFEYSQMRRFFSKMCFEYFVKQYLNDFIQRIFVVEISNSYQCRDLHVDQIDDLFLQIYLQRFRFRRRFFASHWNYFTCNSYKRFDDISKRYRENNERNQKFSRLQMNWIVWNDMKNIEFIFR